MRCGRERLELAIAAGLIGFALAAGSPGAAAAAAAAAAATAEPPMAQAPTTEADAASAADIRDIRLPGGGGSKDRRLAILIGASLAVLAAAALWVWRHRRRPPLRSFQLALQQLEAARGLLRAGRANDYCVAVSRIVRSYIEAGFRIPVTYRTTEEFVDELAGRLDSPLQPHRARLTEFLHDCDAVKFGGTAPTVQDLESLHRSAEALVRATTSEAHDAIPTT
jgi:hypothetical protein